MLCPQLGKVRFLLERGKQLVNLSKVSRDVWLARRILIKLDVQLDQLDTTFAEIVEKFVIRMVGKSNLILYKRVLKLHCENGILEIGL